MPIVVKGRAVFDRGEIQKAERTPQGFLRAPAQVTRTGVFTYLLGDGTMRRELRHPDDVFNPESLATLAGVPVTDDHPNVKDPEVLLLTPENVRDFMVGYTGDGIGEADNRFVTATVTVTDADVIKAVESGKTEVSCGYVRDLEDETGVYDGVPYDCRQRNIVYNHLAIVDRGRAGPEVRIRLDAADAVQIEETKPLEETKMDKVTINGVEYPCTPELKAAVEAALAAKKDGDTSTEVESGKTAEDDGEGGGDKDSDKKDGDMQAKLDAANARADAAVAELKKAKAARNDSAVTREAVKARVRLERVAAKVLPADDLAKLDAMDDRAVKVAVIKAEHKSAVLDGKSDAYVDGRFEAIADSLDAVDGKGEEMGRDLGTGRAAADAGEPDAEAARKRAMERARDAWKRKDQKQA